MAWYSMTLVSRNKKTGPIPVVTASRDSCPSDCPLMNKGCYADHGPLRIVWNRVSAGVDQLSFSGLLSAIRKLPRGQLWRYGQAGDLPEDPKQVVELARATQGRPVIIYTHRRDLSTYKEVAQLGVHINLSASDLDEADELANSGLPVVSVISSEYQRKEGETLRDFRNRVGGSLSFSTKGGRRVAICPATYLETNCSRCQICTKPRTAGTIIGFPAHGSKKRQLDAQTSTRRLHKWPIVPAMQKTSISSQPSARI